MAKTRNDCLRTDDIVSAYEKYQEHTRYASYWWSAVVEIYNQSEHVRWNWVLYEETHIICERFHYAGIDTKGVDLLNKCSNKCYLIRMTDKDGNLVASKVGTTKSTCRKRWGDILNSKQCMDHNITYIQALRVYDCQNLPPEGLESLFRAHFIREFPEAFVANDRFFSIEFNLEEADKLYQEYITKKS